MPVLPHPRPALVSPDRSPISLPEALSLARDLGQRCSLAPEHRLSRDRWCDAAERACSAGRVHRCAALLRAELRPAVAEAVSELGSLVERVMGPPAASDPAWELAVTDGLELVALLVSHARTVVGVAGRLLALEGQPPGAAQRSGSPPPLEVLSSPSCVPEGVEPHAFVGAALAAALQALVESAHVVVGPDRAPLEREAITSLVSALSRTYNALAGALLHHLGAPTMGTWLLTAPAGSPATSPPAGSVVGW